MSATAAHNKPIVLDRPNDCLFVVRKIDRLVRQLRYGEITIKVHDGKVVLIEHSSQERLNS